MARRKLTVLAAFTSLLLLVSQGLTLAAPPAVTANAINQPAGQNSFLVPIDFNAAAKPPNQLPNVIPDNQLASWAATALTTQDPQNAAKRVSMVGGATFLFQNCFGGGFLDDLNTTLTPAGVPWVGGSASQHDQASYGQAKGAPIAGNPANSPTGMPPVNYWTNQLAPLLVNGANMATVIDNANQNDPLGTPKNPAPAISETGQLYYANNGQNVALDNNNNINHYAILFAGFTDAQRHFTSIDAVYTSLAATWKNTPYFIQICYGDGLAQVPAGAAEANPAALPWAAPPKTTVTAGTALNLFNAFSNVQNKIVVDYGQGIKTDQFFFYAGDHGGNTAVVAGGVGGGGPPGTPATLQPLQISPGMFQGMNSTPNAVPTISFNYTMPDQTDDAQIMINGHDIGDLTYDPSGTETFQIPVADLQPGSDSLVLDTVSGTQFTINNATFFTGAIDDGPVAVPEPATIALTALAGTALLIRRRRAA
jgi:hypothetical protein